MRNGKLQKAMTCMHSGKVQSKRLIFSEGKVGVTFHYDEITLEQEIILVPRRSG
uniref:Uncharacterized protein n=1 Tax=Anguilla anguilla TaxID=7936 RepID=A0A0E9Y2M7_ANGAN